jgi:drug/metabolite transporter (DMT)-like permease
VIVTLVLISAFTHALWNALLRVEPDKDRGLVAAVAFASLFAIVVGGARWAAGQVPFATGEAVGWTLAAGAFEAVYFTTLARALEVGRLGAVYTISRGGAVLVVWPLSLAWFAETLTWTSATGSVVVLAGLVLCGLGAPRGGESRKPDAGVGWAVACAVSIAGYHLAYKAALETGGSPSATFAVSLALSAVISIVRHGEGRRALASVLRTRWLRVVLMGILCGGSFLILMEALARGGSGYVLTLRNTSVLFATALAFFVGERPSRPEISGAALVAGGAVLMAW